MNKKELVANVAKKAGLTCAASAKAIDAVFKSIKEGLEKNEATIIQGFGSFSTIQRAERKGINLLTKQPMTIAAHKVMKFKKSRQITIN